MFKTETKKNKTKKKKKKKEKRKKRISRKHHLKLVLVFRTKFSKIIYFSKSLYMIHKIIIILPLTDSEKQKRFNKQFF